jgi:peptide/nickel transport system permease protein
VSSRAGPVATDILQRLPATLELTFASLFLSIVLGVPLGVVSALNHNTWPDYLLRVFSVLGIAVAAFWFAIMLQLFFAMDLAGCRCAAISPRPWRGRRVTGFLGWMRCWPGAGTSSSITCAISCCRR